MITHECKLKTYTVDEYGRVFFVCDKIFIEDGTEIGRVPENYMIIPGEDVSGHEQYVIDICAQVHTQQVIDAWNAGPANL